MIDLSSICPPITTTSFSTPSASSSTPLSATPLTSTIPPSVAIPTSSASSSSSHRHRYRQESASQRSTQYTTSHSSSSNSAVSASTTTPLPRRSRRSTASDPNVAENNMSASTLPAAAASSSPSSSSSTTPQNTTDVILTRVFQDQTNVLKRDDRELIIEFLNGRLRVNPFDPSTSLHRIILNEAKHKDPLHPTRTTIEQIVFEMNFTSGHWRKLRRKAVVRDAVASERFEEHISKDECPGAEWWSGRIPAGWDSNGNKIDSIQAVAAVTTKHAALSVAAREIYVCGR